MKKKKQLQIRPHFQNDDYDASSDWTFAFELLLGNEFNKYLSGQAENEKDVHDCKASELSSNKNEL